MTLYLYYELTYSREVCVGASFKFMSHYLTMKNERIYIYKSLENYTQSK
jgi:hypothetical protein